MTAKITIINTPIAQAWAQSEQSPVAQTCPIDRPLPDQLDYQANNQPIQQSSNPAIYQTPNQAEDQATAPEATKANFTEPDSLALAQKPTQELMPNLAQNPAPETTQPEARLSEMWEPHQSRIPNFELEECTAMHSHYVEQLATCHPKARAAIKLTVKRLEQRMLALMNAM
jgi:hypothetical protein